MKQMTKQELDVNKVVQQFKKSEKNASPRRGTFKINIPPDEAIKKILKARPEPKSQKKRRR